MIWADALRPLEWPGDEQPHPVSAMTSITGGRRALVRLGRLRRRAFDRVIRLSVIQLGRPSQLSWAQRRLTIIIVLAPVVAWSCSLPAGAAFSPWTLTAVVIFTGFTAIRPDSLAGLSTVLFLGWYWFAHVSTHTGDPVSPWTLAAALSLLAFHTATAARATAPDRADLDQAFWRRWTRRVAIIAAATAGVWGLTAAMASEHPGREGLTLAALAVLIVGAAYARWILTRVPTRT